MGKNMGGRPTREQSSERKAVVTNMLAAGMTANQISRHLGVSQQAIYAYMRRHNFETPAQQKR